MKRISTKYLSGRAILELAVEVLGKGFPIKLCAKGYSMIPNINHRDIVTIYPIKNKKIKKDDIIAFIDQDGNNLIIHRVIRKKNNMYLAKGDHLNKDDGFIEKNRIIGYLKIR